jgi:hypothetical protein
MTREEILDDEFVRAKPAGLRLITTGLIKLVEKLGVSVLHNADPAKRNPMEWAAMCFVMDERNPIEEIRAAADEGPAFLDSTKLADYDFRTTPIFLLAVKQEITRTHRAMKAIQFDIEPKPGGREGPQPEGKSSSPPGS